MTDRWNRLADQAPGVGEIRRYGLAAGVELVADRATKTPFPPGDPRGMLVCRGARRRGVFIRPLGDVPMPMPPLTITDEEITVLVDSIGAGIQEVCA
jgi:adenosylmethionine-8-amino-7-oxononanoate aminotransferase